jgi:hypothetical protein
MCKREKSSGVGEHVFLLTLDLLFRLHKDFKNKNLIRPNKQNKLSLFKSH